MHKLELGVSISGIGEVLTIKMLELLEKSGIVTFEYRPEVFAGDYTGSVRAATKEMLERTGKKFITCHIPFSRLDDISDPQEEVRICAVTRLRQQLDEAYFFGCRIIVVHPSMEVGSSEPREIRIMQLRKSLHELAPALTAHGMVLALEWLPRHCMGNSLDELKRMLDRTDEKLFGICLDVNHMMGSYKELPRIVESIGKRLFNLHISDYDGVDEKHMLPGEGVIDWKAFVAALRKADYRGPFNYECRLFGENEAERIEMIEKNARELMGIN